MKDRLTKIWGDKVEIPISPMEIKNSEDRKEYFKVQKEIENIVIRLAEYEDLGSVKDLKNRIQLKNIDLSNANIYRQGRKVIEHGEKFTNYALDTIEDGKEYQKYAIEEFWKMVQYGIGLLQQAGIDADKVMAEYPKYLEKFKKID